MSRRLSLLRERTSHLGLVRHHHHLHDERLTRAAAVRNARVCLAGPGGLTEDEAQRLARTCGARLVATGAEADVVVVADAEAAIEYGRSHPEARWIVDPPEFVAMVRAYCETHRSSRFRAAVAAARKHLRQAPPEPPLANAAPRGEGRGSRAGGMRAHGAGRDRVGRDDGRAAESERHARQIDDLVKSLRSDDPDCRLYRR